MELGYNDLDYELKNCNVNKLEGRIEPNATYFKHTYHRNAIPTHHNKFYIEKEIEGNRIIINDYDNYINILLVSLDKNEYNNINNSENKFLETIKIYIGDALVTEIPLFHIYNINGGDNIFNLDVISPFIVKGDYKVIFPESITKIKYLLECFVLTEFEKTKFKEGEKKGNDVIFTDFSFNYIDNYVNKIYFSNNCILNATKMYIYDKNNEIKKCYFNGLEMLNSQSCFLDKLYTNHHYYSNKSKPINGWYLDGLYEDNLFKNFTNNGTYFINKNKLIKIEYKDDNIKDKLIELGNYEIKNNKNINILIVFEYKNTINNRKFKKI